jgi:isoleucyl-tRNA synthetase
MIHPTAEYAKVKVKNEIWIMAKDLVEELMKEFGIEEFDIIEVKPGKEFVGKKYENPIGDLFPFTKNLENAHRIIESEKYVSLEEGTGLVHCAPGHGKEDFEVGKKFGLPVVNPLKIDGTFNESSGKFAGIFAKDADKLIIDELRRRGVLVKEGKIRHEYPLCWRCDSPLLLQALPQWFFGVTRIRDKLLEENEKIKWAPRWAKDRFKNWLESLGDWPISRQRYWGIPLPIWVCEKCEKVKVIGSVEELPRAPKDLHKPYIDEVILGCECGGKMRRVKDVLDVWFDSGVAPWASLGYPKNKRLFEELWPAYFVLEGPDQIRGWWNSLLITSVMTFGRRPFESVLFHGFLLDAHGIKMSKSKGNVVEPNEVIEKYGRDTLRFYFVSKEVWNDYFFRWGDVHEVARKLRIIRNVFNFVDTYVTRREKEKKLEIEDKWIISRLNSLIKKCTPYFQNFEVHRAVNEMLNFLINDFSHFYIKLVRDRVWVNYEGKDKKAAFYTLLQVSDNLLRLLSPLIPFLTESFYQQMKEKFGHKEISVHLLDWPKFDGERIDEELEAKMEIVKKLVESCLAARNKAKIKLRWPLPELLILPKNEMVEDSVKDLKRVLLKLCNVKEVKTIKKEMKNKFERVETDLAVLFLNKEIDEKLQEEAFVNEVVRNIQELRKKNNLSVWEKVDVFFVTDKSLKKILEKNSERILMRVNGNKIYFDKLEGVEGKFEFLSKEIKFSFKRLKN